MNQYSLIILLIGIGLIYLNKNSEGFLNFKKTCPVIKTNNHIDFEVVGGTLGDRITKKDYGFIKNIKRTFYGKHYKTADIEYGELKEIITKFGKEFENNKDYKFSKINYLPDIKKINKFIMDYLNKHIHSYLLKLDIQIINSYNIINQDILYAGEEEHFYNYQFIISIFRFGTDMYFNIYFDIISGKLKNIIKINQVTIIGIKIKTYTISEEFNKCIIDNNYCNVQESCDINCNNILQQDPDFKIKLDKFIRQVDSERLKIIKEGNQKCYKKFNDSYIVEPKLTNKSICEDNHGTWDSPCTYNGECPFFNVITLEGGCIKDQCMLPWGIEQYSPKKFNTNSEPLCKGCREGYRCCSDQNPPNYIFIEP